MSCAIAGGDKSEDIELWAVVWSVWLSKDAKRGVNVLGNSELGDARASEMEPHRKRLSLGHIFTATTSNFEPEPVIFDGVLELLGCNDTRLAVLHDSVDPNLVLTLLGEIGKDQELSGDGLGSQVA